MPLYPQNVVNQGTYPNSLSLCCFHLRLIVESIKELGGALVGLKKAKFDFFSCL
jgi:hypothetical protein